MMDLVGQIACRRVSRCSMALVFGLAAVMPACLGAEESDQTGNAEKNASKGLTQDERMALSIGVGGSVGLISGGPWPAVAGIAYGALIGHALKSEPDPKACPKVFDNKGERINEGFFNRIEDEDCDGVPGYLDDCPHTPEPRAEDQFRNVQVDWRGCVLNVIPTPTNGAKQSAQCQNEKQAASGRHRCWDDLDGDSVQTAKDKCPDTLPMFCSPRSAWMLEKSVDRNGCRSDADGDGVPDHLDKCPQEPGCIAEWKEGCPLKKGECCQQRSGGHVEQRVASLRQTCRQPKETCMSRQAGQSSQCCHSAFKPPHPSPRNCAKW